MKKVLILIIVILCVGYFLREESFVFNFKDTYFVISYFTIAMFIFYGFCIFSVLRYILLRTKKAS